MSAKEIVYTVVRTAEGWGIDPVGGSRGVTQPRKPRLKRSSGPHPIQLKKAMPW